jgi:hypothetical protein
MIILEIDSMMLMEGVERMGSEILFSFNKIINIRELITFTSVA